MNREIAGLRLQNQYINSSVILEPGQVVRALGAVQAQDYMQAVWAIGVRTPSAGLAGVERAIAERSILLTWSLRGTLHFAPPEDVKWMIQLCAPRLLRQSVRRLEQLELDDKTLGRCRKLIYNALKNGKCLARPDLLKVLESDGISTAGQRGYHILWHSAYNGLICFGPLAGKQQTFVLLDEWVPVSRELSYEESLAELAQRYFTTHGPATVQDFAWWTGLTLTDARVGLDAVRAELVSELIEGIEYWMPDKRAASGEALGVQLLPGFDEYLLGYKDRSAVLEPEAAQQVVPGNNGMFMPMIVEEGQIIGTWKRTIKKKGAELLLLPFKPLKDHSREQLVSAAEAYAAFLGLPLTRLEYL